MTWHEVPSSRLSQAGDGPDVAGQRRVWQSWLDEPRLGRLSEVLVAVGAVTKGSVVDGSISES